MRVGGGQGSFWKNKIILSLNMFYNSTKDHYVNTVQVFSDEKCQALVKHFPFKSTPNAYQTAEVLGGKTIQNFRRNLPGLGKNLL